MNCLLPATNQNLWLLHMMAQDDSLFCKRTWEDSYLIDTLKNLNLAGNRGTASLCARSEDKPARHFE